MLSVLTFSSGRTLKRAAKPEIFMPHYIDEPKPSTTPTLEEQQKEFAAFSAKLKVSRGSK